MGVFAGGNILLEAAPGLGKTLIGKTLAAALSMRHARIQFTPDLMPADIIGTNIIVEDERGNKEMVFQRGPVFTNLLLADEINRAPPKTQSALLEAMQEHHVTVAGKTYALDEPFLVVATQNPEDREGTYRLPEAQLDRFLFRLRLTALSDQEWIEVVAAADRDRSSARSGPCSREKKWSKCRRPCAGWASTAAPAPTQPGWFAQRIRRTTGVSPRSASTCGWGPARAESRP